MCVSVLESSSALLRGFGVESVVEAWPRAASHLWWRSLIAVPLAILLGAPLLPAQKDEPATVVTSRHDTVLPTRPASDQSFSFVIFGDRTAGPTTGFDVLRQAVDDTNLLAPDLVMTVGNLIQGCDPTQEWLAQARDLRHVMSGLRMPWFPAAGDHELYWRGPDAPPNEHEAEYERTFGPLWYAFPHKGCWFVVLDSDEGDPATGRRDFRDPAAQRMSQAQLTWLEDVLQRAHDARHVFVFVHHPRWLPEYGNGWQPVHRALVEAGNVTAVFAGQLHHLRDDGMRDGIEYVVVGTTGGERPADVPAAGDLDHVTVVTVRPEGIAIAAVPVGAVVDPRRITPEVGDDVARLQREAVLRQSGLLTIDADGRIDDDWQVTVHNPATRPLELTLAARCHDRRVTIAPQHLSLRVAAGKEQAVRFHIDRPAAAIDVNFDAPIVTASGDYLGKALRVPLPPRELDAAFAPPPLAGQDLDTAADDGVLALDGDGDALRVASTALTLPSGPFTVETWLRAHSLGGRRMLIGKDRNAELALSIVDARPRLALRVAGRQVEATAAEPCLQVDHWHHVAGVYDGRELRLYVDGVVRAHVAATGARDRDDGPLFIGADVDAGGRPTACFEGLLDEVRLSRGTRYYDQPFQPAERFTTDDDTVLLLHLDRDVGLWTPDASSSGAHAERLGDARCTLESRATIR